MFVQDQQKQVIFNMKFYSLKRVGSQLHIFDHKQEYLGIIAEYEDENITAVITEEIVELLEFCFHNKVPCVYSFPEPSEIKGMMQNG